MATIDDMFLLLFFRAQFFCFLLLVLVAEIATGAWVYHNRDKLDSMVRSSVKYTVQHEYGQIDDKTAALDTFQTHVSIIACKLCYHLNSIDRWIHGSL